MLVLSKVQGKQQPHAWFWLEGLCLLTPAPSRVKLALRIGCVLHEVPRCARSFAFLERAICSVLQKGSSSEHAPLPVCMTSSPSIWCLCPVPYLERGWDELHDASPLQRQSHRPALVAWPRSQGLNYSARCSFAADKLFYLFPILCCLYQLALQSLEVEEVSRARVLPAYVQANISLTPPSE